MIPLQWSAFKAFVDAKSLSVQYAEDTSFYYLVALDTAITFSSKISKTLEGDSTDLSDFETNYKPNGNRPSSDIIDKTGVYGTLTVGTSAVELKVGASRLSGRKLATVDNTSTAILYWAWDSSVSTTAYAGRIFPDQQLPFAVGPNKSVYLIAGTAGNQVHISEGA